jgi:hypothetical protein
MKKSAALIAALLVSLPAAARQWNPTSQSLAVDYSMITESRPNRELVQIYWMTWPMAAGAPQATLRDLLDKYVILGVAHGQVDAGGKMVFNKDEGAQAASLDGTALKEISEASYPPAVAGAIAALGSFMRQSLGAMGEGVKFLVFESGDVRACEKGRLSVTYSSETYTYDTPIPGCPKP